ncbi:hypothetical protein F2P79_025565 [Pimephales promelas]|nr:hypothetical protein F2P79_025565 [Pimephales promelas]
MEDGPPQNPESRPSGIVPAKPQPRERAWQNQRGKKTLSSLAPARMVGWIFGMIHRGGSGLDPWRVHVQLQFSALGLVVLLCGAWVWTVRGFTVVRQLVISLILTTIC